MRVETLPRLTNEQGVAIGVLEANLALRHVFGIRNRGNIDAVCEQMIAQDDKVG